jgi:hypothetical protein
VKTEEEEGCSPENYCARIGGADHPWLEAAMTYLISFMMFSGLRMLPFLISSLALLFYSNSSKIGLRWKAIFGTFLLFPLISISWFRLRSQNMGDQWRSDKRLTARPRAATSYEMDLHFFLVFACRVLEVIETDKWGPLCYQPVDELLWPQILGTFAKSFLILIACLTIPVLLFNLNCFPGLLP